MITQGLLDWFSSLFATIINGIPDVPGDVEAVFTQLQVSAGELGTFVTKFGFVVPFDTVGALIAAWASVMGFWLVMAGGRVILWLVGR